MKASTDFIGIVLIVAGILVFVFKGFNYTENEKIAQVGDLKVTAQTEKSVYLPPILGGLSIGAGLVLLVIGRINRKE